MGAVFVLFSFLGVSQAAVISIDLGSEWVKVALVKVSELHMIL